MAKTNTHCASYIVDELTADRTDKLDNGCQFSFNSKNTIKTEFSTPVEH